MSLGPSFFFASLAGGRPWGASHGRAGGAQSRSAGSWSSAAGHRVGRWRPPRRSARYLRHGAHVWSYPHAACLCCPVPPERGEAAAQRSVNEVIPDLNGHTTYDVGIDDDIQLNAAAVEGGQRRRQPFALAV